MADKITPEAFEDDMLSRKNIAEHFKQILLNTDVNVFSVVAPWGAGKSYFINNLVKLIEKDTISILYNAWESDFYHSPLIPLLVELLNKLENCAQTKELEKDIEWSKNFAQKICSSTTFQVGIDMGIVNCSANFDPAKKLNESEYLELKSKIQEFKLKLQSIQKKLDKKIIIFIDELDRCHPMYTIKTLEVIKHFFGIPNIIFVLAVDKIQIENSVRTIYGINKGEENGYLRKFIDVEFQLPEYNSKEFIAVHLMKIWNKIEKFIQHGKYYNYKQKNNSPDEAIKLCDFIFILTNLFKLSLRDIEKLFMRIELTLDALSKKDVLLIEPCIIFNLLSIYKAEATNNYIELTGSEKIQDINNAILPYWKGLFLNSYKKTIDNSFALDEIKENTVTDNATNLRLFLQNTVSSSVIEQEEYLRDYPMKIKFINNFQSFD